MKINAFYRPEDTTMTISYDRGAQKIFARVAREMKHFQQDEDLMWIMKEIHPDSLPDFDRGIAFIHRLGSDPARKMDSGWNELAQSLHLLCGAALYFLKFTPRRPPFAQAIVLVAEIAPFGITRRALPPAAEIFDQKTVPQQVRQDFELLRLWPHPIQPYLPFSRIHQLWWELASVPSYHPELVKLEWELERMTNFFHFTMASLAQDDFFRCQKKYQKGERK